MFEPSHTQGETRPIPAHLARATEIARQLFPLAPDDDTELSIPLFRLSNVLADAITEALPSAGPWNPTYIRLHAAGLLSRAFPPVQDPSQRIALPLTQLVDLLAQAMAATVTPTPTAFAQADALERGIRQVLAVLHDLHELADAIDTSPPDIETEKLPDYLALAEEALKAAVRSAGALCHVYQPIGIDAEGGSHD